MSICLCNRTADLALRELRRQGKRLGTVSSQLVKGCRPDLDEAEDIISELGLPSSTDLEVLVGLQENRRSTGRLVTHLWSEDPPEGSFYALDEGAYLPTPCFCLLQQARELHPIQLCQMLGYYMGTEQVSQTINDTTTTVTLPPLVTEEELSSYLNEAKGMKGVKALREALRYTCTEAASPQETNLQLMLTLPLSYYGFGLELPIMNYQIDLHEQARKLYPHHYCLVDLYWRRLKGGLEFQGAEHGSQLGEDYARFLALDAEGEHIWFVAKEQLESATQMQYLARRVAEGLGVKVDGPLWPLESDTQRLIDIVMCGKQPARGERRRVRKPRATR